MQIKKFLRQNLLLGALMALIMLAVSIASYAAPTEPGEDHVHYSNQRFKFYFVYPSCLTPRPEPANGDGIQADCKKLGLHVTASGQYNVLGSTASEAIQSLVPPGVKFQRVPDFAEDSERDMGGTWVHEGYVNWVRARRMPPLNDGEEERMITIYVKYPQRQASQCRPLVDGIMCTLVDLK